MYRESPITDPTHRAIGTNDAIFQLMGHLGSSLTRLEHSRAIFGMKRVEPGIGLGVKPLAGPAPNGLISGASVNDRVTIGVSQPNTSPMFSVSCLKRSSLSRSSR